MSHGPCSLGGAPLAPIAVCAADCRFDLQATINVRGSVSASASITTRPVLVFILLSISAWDRHAQSTLVVRAWARPGCLCRIETRSSASFGSGMTQREPKTSLGTALFRPGWCCRKSECRFADTGRSKGRPGRHRTSPGRPIRPLWPWRRRGFAGCQRSPDSSENIQRSKAGNASRLATQTARPTLASSQESLNSSTSRGM